MFCDKRGQVFYFFVRFYLSILNQSTSTQPPSLVLMTVDEDRDPGACSGY